MDGSESEIREGKPFNDARVESGLCERCNKTDFKLLAYYTPSTSYNDALHIPYGSLSSLAKRRECRLCRFLWDEATSRGLLPESNHDIWQTSIKFSKSHFIARKNTELKDSLGSRIRFPSIHVHQLSLICYQPDNNPSGDPKIPPTTLLVLDPSVRPLPVATGSGQPSEVLEDVETSRFSARLLPLSGLADLTLCARWLKLCTAVHGSACSSDALCTEPLPQHFTVIDVQNLCLVAAPLDCCYITLSYVWGQEKFLTCKRDNVANLHLPGALTVVPATVKDAMSVTIALHERYLWVDALCIIQDSQESLLEHIAHMGTVYARSTLTIVAQTTTKADDGLNGVSRSNDRTTQSVIDIKSLTMVASSPHSMDNDVWSRRGWTMQEELLSRRQLIFGKREISWKCRETTWLESAVLEVENSLPYIPYNGHEEILLLDTYRGSSADETQQALLRQLRFRQTYNKATKAYFVRHLTYASDKLHAYKAIEDALSLSNNDRFIYGLPESCFTKTLCWNGNALVRNEALHTERDASALVCAVKFPSWSWCGWQGSRLGPLREQQSPITVFYYRDGSGVWRKIKERTKLAIPTVPEEILHDLKQNFGSVLTPLLRFRTSTVALHPMDASPVDTPENLIKQCCWFESPLAKEFQKSGHARRLQLKCEVDVLATWEYLSNIKLPNSVTSRRMLWPWGHPQNEASRAPSSKRTFLGAAVGLGLFGQYIFCLILESKSNGFMERIGGVQLGIAEWDQLEKLEQVVTLM